MSFISNRHYKFIVGSIVIFVIFVFLLTQPTGVSNSITKPSRLDNSPDINTSNTVPISNKAPYSKTGGDKKPDASGKDAVDDDVAPIKDTDSESKQPASNKIQANKDKAESVQDGKNANKDIDIATGSSSFGSDSTVPETTKDKAIAGNDAKKVGEVSPSDNCKDKVEYVVMIDAGSTGSRIHIYSFDLCYSPPKLLNEEFKMLNPGLSSFDTDAVAAAKSLDPLLELALQTVPEKQRSCTPVAVKATAGLRLLGKDKSDKILAEVRRHLEEDYPFAVVEGDGISIMDGSLEGVYAWITTNYLLGNIGSSSKLPTAAVFDLGGGSTQIVFEPKDGEKMIDGEHKFTTSFGGRDFTLYQYSHLGYGLMEGRNKVNSLVLSTHLKDAESKLAPLTPEELSNKEIKAKATVAHPCIPPGVTAENVKVKIDDSTYLVNFKSPATSEEDPLAQSAGTQCRFLADTVLNKELECKTDSCSFNGIYQPSLLHQFDASNDMFIFSYFYDRLNPLGMPNSFTLDEIKDITKLVCSGSKFWTQYLIQETSVAELKKEPQWCLDLSFMVGLLHTGYDIPLARELKTAKKINNNELGWCLGASLPLLDKDAAGWKCKVKEVSAKAGSP